MITPSQIKKKAENWYEDFLISCVEGSYFFPKILPSDKKSLGDSLVDLKKEMEELLQDSKNVKGFGYRVDLKTIETRRNGRQSLPERILFESELDYLRFIGKESEIASFRKNIELIRIEMPQLENWLVANVKRVIQNEKIWLELLKVCKFFVSTPKPNLYVRELPIKVHTKFIEQNKGILRQLLDFLIPDYINQSETHFETRFHLKYNQPFIRLNILDEEVASAIFSGLNDIAIPLSDFEKLDMPIDFVFVFENKTNFSNVYNFLTLPHLKKSIAIFGQGFGAENLANASWLQSKQIFYWGDIDTHGLLILNQLRKHFPHVKTFLMDDLILMKYSDDWDNGEETHQEDLAYLNNQECKLYNFIKEKNIRLEQEKIRHDDVISAVLNLFNHSQNQTT